MTLPELDVFCSYAVYPRSCAIDLEDSFLDYYNLMLTGSQW